METDYKSKLDTETLKKIISFKSEYNSILSKKMIKVLNQVKQRHFELTDIPNKLLAWRHNLYIGSEQKMVLF